MLGRRELYDVVILDTAGRLAIDEALMEEVAQVKLATNPHETLLVVDAMTGQDAVNTAKAFQDKVGVTGIVMTRIDGGLDPALSMRAVTGAPIKLLGAGEKLDALEDFHPDRIASRILGMGDIDVAGRRPRRRSTRPRPKLAARMQKNRIHAGGLCIPAEADRQDGRRLQGILGMLPGVGKIKQQLNDANLDTSILGRQAAIISSMTPRERCRPT